jgi:DNA-binding YbaB/EbfC family protein
VSDIEPSEGGEPEGLGLDLGALLGQAQAMQQQILDAQAEVAAQVVEGQSGGGVVRIEVTGGWEFRSVTIDPAVGDDHEMIADLVLAALRDAAARVAELHEQSVGGVDLGGLGGLLGGAG